MGNNSTSGALNSLRNKDVPEFFSQLYNPILRAEPQNTFEATKLPVAKRGPILHAFIISPGVTTSSNPVDNRQYKILLAYGLGVQMYDLVTGKYIAEHKEREESKAIVWACQGIDEFGKNAIVIACKDGLFRILELQMLQIVSQFGGEIEDSVTCIIAPQKEIIFAGYESGTLRDWHFTEFSPSSETKIGQTAIKRLAYSPGHEVMFIGCANTYEEPSGRLMKLPENPIHVLGINDKSTRQLSTFSGDCIGIQILEHRSLVTALNGENEVFLWDIASGMNLMHFTVPQVISGPQSCTSIYIIKDQFLIGLSDGSVLVALLSLEEDWFFWKPEKVIIPKSIDKQETNVTYVSHMWFDEVTDILLIGNAMASVRVVNNFVRSFDNPNLQKMSLFSPSEKRPEASDKIEESEPPVLIYKSGKEFDDEPKAVESENAAEPEQLEAPEAPAEPPQDAPERKTIFGFQRFLHEKQPELREENPSLTHKELIMKVSMLWGTLGKDEKELYDEPIEIE